MSNYINSNNSKKITTSQLLTMKQNGEKISMLTSYDYTFAKIIDKAGIDIILVGDSASNVMAGNKTTLPITLDEMIYHAKSVARATTRALIVADMPFGTVAGDVLKSLEAAIRMIKETGADAVKIEGGAEVAEDIRKIINAGIPVMGHLGLMPQSINKYGSYALRGTDKKEADKLIDDAKLLQQLGCFAIVLEKIPSKLAMTVSKKLDIPIIGIGAGPDVDGQVLVIQDMLGINQDFSPKFLRRYANLNSIITEAVQHYDKDVKDGEFPNASESY